MGKIYKRKDSRFFWAAFTIDGRTYRESTGTTKKREAEAEMQKRIEEAGKGHYPILRDSKRLTFDAWAEHFLSMYSAPPFRSEKTHSYHQANIKALGKVFSGRRLIDISPDAIEQYRAERLKQSTYRGNLVKPATVNREVETLRRMFNVARRKNRVIYNPCDGVERLSEKRGRRRAHCMTMSEQQAITMVAPEQLGAVVAIIAETGLRIYKELTSMRKDQVDLDQGVIHIEDSKTESGIRSVPLTETAFKEFARLKAQAPESPWLFPSPLKPENHVTTFKRSWRTALRRAGVSYFPIYDLRSTFATRLSAGGVMESFVMDLLGQKDPSAMKRYSFARMEQLRDAVGKLDRQTGETQTETGSQFVQ